MWRSAAEAAPFSAKVAKLRIPPSSSPRTAASAAMSVRSFCLSLVTTAFACVSAASCLMSAARLVCMPGLLSTSGLVGATSAMPAMSACRAGSLSLEKSSSA